MVAPEDQAALTPLVLLEGDAARAIRRRRSTPVGYVPVYLGFLVHPNWKGRGLAISPRKTWEEWDHERHWAWLNSDDAFGVMASHARRDVSVRVLKVWCPVRESKANPQVLEIGPAAAELVQGWCWTALAEDVVLEGVEAGPTELYSRRPNRTSKNYLPEDLRGWATSLERP